MLGMSEFDTLGDTYERSAVELPFREHVEHHSVRQAVGDVTGLTVLDMGCGSGIYTRRLATWGARHVTGIDVSGGMLATGHEREHAQQAGVTYLRRDATRPGPAGDPLLDGTCDVVVSVYALCYAVTEQELTGFLTTARRALKPGGRLVAMTLNPDYGRGVRYYAGYGFSLTQHEEGEGAPVTLAATLPGGLPMSVTARWWSHRAYEKAASAAGFARSSWAVPTVSETGASQYGSAYWTAYLNAPQAVILNAAVG
ncbi:class I SAM-dependent methyltransferase [Streptomyces sp. NPDC006649]|uniref:class I SAM-dependent methyltransferase n=1 Tax=Streptomyces sp. NPDC006649 TaxID=3156896 RepID=UPI0033B0A974